MADNTKDTGILGLGGAPVPKDPLDPVATNDAESVRRRRDRMREGEATDRAAGDQHAGATGIDMGAGGEGTDLSGR